jgi:DnaJ-class molecular chaperone
MAELNEHIPCPSCSGVGREGKNRECDACDGTGVITIEVGPARLAVVAVFHADQSVWRSWLT